MVFNNYSGDDINFIKVICCNYLICNLHLLQTNDKEIKEDIQKFIKESDPDEASIEKNSMMIHDLVEKLKEYKCLEYVMSKEEINKCDQLYNKVLKTKKEKYEFEIQCIDEMINRCQAKHNKLKDNVRVIKQIKELKRNKWNINEEIKILERQINREQCSFGPKLPNKWHIAEKSRGKTEPEFFYPDKGYPLDRINNTRTRRTYPVDSIKK